MIPIDQTIFGFKKGNCHQACLASVLEESLEDIPNFWEGNEENVEGFWKDQRKWLRFRGWNIINVRFEEEYNIKESLNEAIVIAMGKSPRDISNYHAVVWQSGEIIHDPHPSKDGLIGKPKEFSILFPLDPSLFNSII